MLPPSISFFCASAVDKVTKAVVNSLKGSSPSPWVSSSSSLSCLESSDPTLLLCFLSDSSCEEARELSSIVVAEFLGLLDVARLRGISEAGVEKTVAS